MKRRNTPAKEAVLNVLKHEGIAMSQDAIEQKLTIDVNRVTIYRILNRFCEDGIIHKVVAENGKQYFALDSNTQDTEHQHFHFKCTICDTIECLPNEIKVTVPDGYRVENVNSIITGVCKKCV